MDKDELWMKVALAEAEGALDEGDVPVGAVVVANDRVIGRGHNHVEALGDPTAHAEILAIGAACRTLKASRLTGAAIYVTMEPCPMCAGAIVLARLDSLVYGCPDSKSGYCGSLGNITDDPALNHRVSVRSGVLEGECATLLSRFFAELRRSGGA
ncbi:MAG: tRNA adenosine(34) deaminase TadA [Candidatus Eisenbacteria bacterium]